MVWENASVAGFPRNDLSPGTTRPCGPRTGSSRDWPRSPQVAFTLTGGGEPQKVEGRRVSASFFLSSASRPRSGASFSPTTTGPGPTRGRPQPRPLAAAVRRGPGCRRPRHRPERSKYTVIGVMPRGLPVPGELRRPLGAGGARRRGAGEPGAHYLTVVGADAAGGHGPPGAEADVATVSSRVAQRLPGDALPVRAFVLPLARAARGRRAAAR